MKSNFMSSSREDVTKKKKTNNNRKFNFYKGKLFRVNKNKFKSNNLEVKKTDMTDLNQNNQNPNDVNIYVDKAFSGKICSICGENISKDDLKKFKLRCKHFFCADCYYEYIKEKINNNQFLQINCPQKDCEEIIGSNMLVKILINDQELLNKYNKLIKRNQIMLDPNKQLCPFPDCESYAIKIKKSKYVKCIQNKHKFCFICLKDWHDNTPCKDSSLSNSLNVLENANKVKRCPKCKFFIEKGEGCNHMTCFNCRYQFCWLCMGEYTSNHFSRGMCRGLQYTREVPSKCYLFFNGIVLTTLIYALKSILFGLGAPYVLIAYIHYEIYYKFRRRENFWTFVHCASGILACLTFSAPLLSISFFIGTLMFFIWPLSDKILDHF